MQMNNFFKRSTACCLGFFLTLAMNSSVYGQRPGFPEFPNQPSRQSQSNKPAVQNIRVDNDRITADIVDSPIQSVLLELAERTGVIFEVRTQENPLVSIHIDRIPLKEAIQRIAIGNNTIFLYQEKNPEQIRLVRVFPQKPAGLQPGILYLGTGVVTRLQNAIETPEEALKALAENAGDEEKEKAIAVLADNKSDTGIKALMNCMSDHAPGVRIAAIEGLAGLDVHEALAGIVKSLKDRHPGVRQSATMAVALLGDSTNIKDLKPLIRDMDPSVVAAAELAIRKLSVTGTIK
jgi:hypothetical protein